MFWNGINVKKAATDAVNRMVTRICIQNLGQLICIDSLTTILVKVLFRTFKFHSCLAFSSCMAESVSSSLLRAFKVEVLSLRFSSNIVDLGSSSKLMIDIWPVSALFLLSYLFPAWKDASQPNNY